MGDPQNPQTQQGGTSAQGLDPNSVVPLTSGDTATTQSGLDPNSVVPVGGSGTLPPSQSESWLHKQYREMSQEMDEHPVRASLGFVPSLTSDIGAAKGIGDTLHTVGRGINAMTGDHIPGLPTSLDSPDYLKAQGVGEYGGKAAEGLLEVVVGDEALKSLSLAKRLGIAQKIASLAEEHPVIAKILNLGIQASRQGVATGASTLGKTGDPAAAAVGGAAGAGVSLGLGTASELYHATKAASAVAKFDPQELQEGFKKGIKDLIDQTVADEGVSKPKTPNIRDYAHEAGQNMEDKAVEGLQEVDKAAKQPFIQRFRNDLRKIDVRLNSTEVLTGSPEEAELLAKRQDIEEEMTRAYEEARANLPPQPNGSPAVPEQQVKENLALFKRAQAMKDFGREIRRPSIYQGLPPSEGTTEQAANNPESIKPGKLLDRLLPMRDTGRLNDAFGEDRARSLLLHANDYEVAERNLLKMRLTAEKQLKDAKSAAKGIGAGVVGGGAAYAVGHHLAGSMVDSVIGQ